MKGKTCSGKDIPRILYLGESFKGGETMRVKVRSV